MTNNDQTSPAPISSLAVERGRKGITVTETGSIVIEGKAGINLYRLLTIRSGLKLEMVGLRLTSRAPSCFSIIKKEFGIKVGRGAEGKRAAYEAFCTMHGFDF